MIKPHNIYEFSQIEKFLNEADGNVFLKVSVVDTEGIVEEIGLMTTFKQNFSKDWQSGDGIIFWEHEETSSEPSDEFYIHEILKL